MLGYFSFLPDCVVARESVVSIVLGDFALFYAPTQEALC